MSLAGDILGLGLSVMREVTGAVTGTIAAPGSPTTSAWTQGRVVSQSRQPGEGNKDVEELVVEIQAAGLSVTPLADMRVVISGNTWVVISADPIAPGGTVVAWRLELRDWTGR